MSDLHPYLSQLLNAATFECFKEGIVTDVTEAELTYQNSIQKVVNLKLLKNQYLQIMLTTEIEDGETEPNYIISMQFTEDDIYVDVVDDTLFLTLIHLVDEVYQFMQPIIYQMNCMLRNNQSNMRIDTSYLQFKIDSFKNVSDEKKEQIYSLYNILFI